MSTPKKRNNKWHGTVYSHTENGKRIYQSITADTKAEWYAAEKEFKAKKALGEKKEPKNRQTVGDIVEQYIALKEPVLSPTTIDAYKRVRAHAFPGLMAMQVSDLNKIVVQSAIADECKRTTKKGNKPLSAKTIKNEWFLISTALKELCDITYRVTLPKVAKPIIELPEPAEVFDAVRGTEIELPCVLAMWLSLSASEIHGLKWEDYENGKLHINRVRVRTSNGLVEKKTGKAEKRIRVLSVPPYIEALIADISRESEYIVQLSPTQVEKRFRAICAAHKWDSMSFHKLRHINASVMALLSVPTQYAQERGGWKTPHTMQGVYTHTFGEARKIFDNIIDDYFENIVKNSAK